MSKKYGYESIDKNNKQNYAAFLDEAYSAEDAGKLISIGITDEKKPCGAVLLRREKNLLSVVDISADFKQAEDASLVYREMFETLSKYAAQNGYKEITCRYTDDEPGISEEVLRAAGFSDFREETAVYRISAWVLGLLLRDGADSVVMRENSVRILDEGKAWRFSEADKEITALFTELRPRDTLSFLTVEKDNALESYVAVSSLPDGSLYLADLRCSPGCERDLSGLLYLSLGAMFMETEPDGEIYVAAVNKRIENLVEHIIRPVNGNGINIQRLYRAGKLL